MLRYIFLKFPGFTNITQDLYASSPNSNVHHLLRPVSPTSKREYRREARRNVNSLRHPYRRSLSFPSEEPKSNQIFDNEALISKAKKKGCGKITDLGKKGIHHGIKKLYCEKSKIAEWDAAIGYSTVGRKKETGKKKLKEQGEIVEEIEPYSYDVSEQYELEAANPRKSKSEIAFNIFDYIENFQNNSSSLNYLQPNRLKPFGSNDNIYHPTVMSSKPMSLILYPRNHDLEEVTTTAKKGLETKDCDENHQRKFSTISPRSIEKIKNSAHIVDPSESFYPRTKSNKSNDLPATCTDIFNHKDSNSSCVPKKVSSKFNEKVVDQALDGAERTKQKPLSGTVHLVSLNDKKHKETDKKYVQPYESTWIQVEKENEPINSDCLSYNLQSNKELKPNKVSRSSPPWPAYSESVNQLENPPLRDSTEELYYNDVPQEASQALPAQKSTYKSEPRFPKEPITMGETPLVVTKNLCQTRSLSTERIRPLLKKQSTDINDETKKSISSLNLKEEQFKFSVTPNAISTNKMNMSKKSSHGKHPGKSTTLPLEPKNCQIDKKVEKCFLPSKVRLKPPPCMPRPPYLQCVKPEPCPPRADECLKECPKKLPPLPIVKCPCVEPEIPDQQPKMRRLKFCFKDTPRVCPCNPCPCPPRADDCLKIKPKPLPPFKPGDCKCIEPPPMTDVPLIRLKKICEPEEKCYPKKECPCPEPCIRADDCLQECPKPLPPLKVGPCPCVEPFVPDRSPRLRRLCFEFNDTPRVCPCITQCPCPPRADDCFKAKPKKLPPFNPGNCECVEPPPMTDFKLRRLKKVPLPPECPRECPVEICEEKVRADDCLCEKPKKLPIIEATKCVCVEPFIPDIKPSLKRLCLHVPQEPRVCPCEHNKCPCPPRADDCFRPKEKKLPPFNPGNCECIEPPPMTDVPLIRLKKICEPEEICYPKKECPCPEPCVRADDCLCEPKKQLPPLEVKICPCVEPPPLVDVPKLKRLCLHVPDKKKVCPSPCVCKINCPRADDCLDVKPKPLPKLPTGVCPCVEKDFEDVPPLPRLKCKDEEICDPCDPCLDFPRADWGCWEYFQPSEEAKHDCSNKKETSVSYNTKRKFNTDSRTNTNLNHDIQKYKQKVHKSETYLNELKSFKAVNAISADPNIVKDSVSAENVKKLELFKKRRHSKMRSLPTINLLKQLEEIEKKGSNDNITFKIKRGQGFCLNKITLKIPDLTTENDEALLTSHTKKQTVQYPPNRPMSTGSISGTEESTKSKKCKKKCVKKQKLVCMKKCPTIILPHCPPKNNPCQKDACFNERTPVCCTKKLAPNPAFSECMHEEIAPYSKMAQWTCNRKEYGFDPNYKKPDEPLETVKNRKHFSTATIMNQCQNVKSTPKENFAIGQPRYFTVDKPRADPGLSTVKRVMKGQPKHFTVDMSGADTGLSTMKPLMKDESGIIHRVTSNRVAFIDSGMKQFRAPGIDEGIRDKIAISIPLRSEPNSSTFLRQNVKGEIVAVDVNNSSNVQSKKYGNVKKEKKHPKTYTDLSHFYSAGKSQTKIKSEREEHSPMRSVSFPISALSNKGIDKNSNQKNSEKEKPTNPRDGVSLAQSCHRGQKNPRGYGIHPKEIVRLKTCIELSRSYSMDTTSENKSRRLLKRHSTITIFNKEPHTCNIHHSRLNQFCRYQSNAAIKNAACDDKKQSGGDKKSCKKNCPSFTLKNCPPKIQESCFNDTVEVVCKKAPAPYPSFRECVDHELEVNISECPLEKRKYEMLQPRHMNVLPAPDLVEPTSPSQGKLDYQKEEEAIRRKLCLLNKGLTQGCKDFGQFVKPMKSKDYIIETNRDCEKIEQLKRANKCSPKNVKKFCTLAGNNWNFQKKGLCSFTLTFSATNLFEKKTNRSKRTTEQHIGENFNKRSNKQRIVLTKPKRLYVRNYHVLCKMPEKNNIEGTDKGMRETLQNPLISKDEPCKLMTLRNVQWRINNFQKWHRLNKFSNIPNSVKRYHNNSKNKYRRQLKNIPIHKSFSTTTTKVCNSVNSSEANPSRGITTTTIFLNTRKKQKGKYMSAGRVKRYPKFNMKDYDKFKKERKKSVKISRKTVTPYPSFGDKMDDELMQNIREHCDIQKAEAKSLQPQYPILPEIETSSMKPFMKDGKIDPYIEIEYVRHKFGIKNEGVSQNCNSFGTPITRLNYSKYFCSAKANDESDIKHESSDTCSQPGRNDCKHPKKSEEISCIKMKQMTCLNPCREQGRNINQCCSKAIDATSDLKDESCDTHKKREKSPCVKMKQMTCLNPCREQGRSINTRLSSDSCGTVEDVCNSTIQQESSCKPEKLTLWQKIVNYFKARPNCPAPDEWKKKALREKAEKAAKAAGLALCDPNDLPRRCDEDLPTVVTPSRVQDKEIESDDCEENDSNAKTVTRRKGSRDSYPFSRKRSFSTISKRFYSRNINLKNLDDINSSLEEDKKKKLAKKILKPLNEGAHTMKENSCDDLEDPHHKDCCGELNKIDTNDTRAKEFEDDDDPLVYNYRILPKHMNVLDVIFNEPLDEVTGYTQAKTFAAFLEYFNQIETLSDINYDEIEKSKTNKMLKELDDVLRKLEENRSSEN